MNDEQRWDDLTKDESHHSIKETFDNFWSCVTHDICSQTIRVAHSKASLAFARSIAFEAFLSGISYGEDRMRHYEDDGK